MTDRLTLRYRTPVAGHDHLLAAAGRRVTGHEFHRTVVEPAYGERPAWLVDGGPSGFATDTLHASYLHLHWAGHPHLAQRFADAVHAYAAPLSENCRQLQLWRPELQSDRFARTWPPRGPGHRPRGWSTWR